MYYTRSLGDSSPVLGSSVFSQFCSECVLSRNCIIRLLSWILVKNAGDSSLARLKDKNGYTASEHAGMGKTPRYTLHIVNTSKNFGGS